MIIQFKNKQPKIHETVYIARGATIIGDVTIGEYSSVWFNTVIRGDVNYIKIGARTNIQDLSMLHVTFNQYPMNIGDEVTIGHNVNLHGCTIGYRSLIGIGATVLDNVVIGEETVIGANSLVTEGANIPPRVLAFGSPAKVIRKLTDEEIKLLKVSADHYVMYSEEYKKDDYEKIRR